MIIGITDYVNPPYDLEARALGGDSEFIFFDSENENDFDGERLQRVEALLVWHAVITERTVRHLDNCRIVVRYGVGYDNIDVAALAARGIPFCNNPDYGTEEVADTACALILSLQRRIFEYDFAARHFTSGWQEHTLSPLKRTNTQTVGIIGVGRIGTALANRLKPFGYRILGYDPYQPSGHEKAVGYDRAFSLDQLLAEADVVTLHCPQTSETESMVDSSFLGRMKPGACLVNTARGGLVLNLDVIGEALKDGRLAAVGLDVLPEEPPGKHPLIEAWRNEEPWIRGRLIITPHTSYFSAQAWEEMRLKVGETIRLYLDQGILRNLISP